MTTMAINKDTADRIAELVAAAPPIDTVQREAVVRIMGSALRRDPKRSVGIFPRPKPVSTASTM